MLIQNLVPRRNNAPVRVAGAAYTFEPNKQGDCVCEIENKAHLKILLAHKGVYRPYSAEQSQLEKEAAAEAEAKRLAKQAQGGSQATGGDRTKAKDADDAEAEDPEVEDIVNEPPTGHPSPKLTQEALMAMEVPALAGLFKKVAGREPHPNTSKEKLVKALLAHQDKPKVEGSA